MPGNATGKAVRTSKRAVEDGRLRPLNRSLPMALLRAREAVMERFRQWVRDNGLTEQQWRVVRVLAEREPLEVSRLAEHTFLLPSSLSRILRSLEEKRLIRRRNVDNDQRRFEVSLTGPGHRLFRQVAPRSETIYREIEEAFGAARLQELYDLLSDLEGTLTSSRVP